MIYNRKNKRDGITYWFIRYDLPNGRRRKEKAGTTRRDAVELLTKRKAAILNKTYRDPSEEPTVTFESFGKRFLDEYRGRRGELRSNHYQTNLLPLREFFSDKVLSEIDRADIDRFTKWRRSQVGASTLRKNLTVLGTVFKMAVRWGVVETSPAFDLDKPSEPKHKTRYLSHDEWCRLLAAAPGWLQPMLRLALAGGLRLKEVTELRWDDIDREARLLYVSENTKSGRADPVPLSGEAESVLREQPRRIGCPYVFVDVAGHGHVTKAARLRISKFTISAMRRAGIENASFHTLRHTAASWMVQHGRPIAEVQKVMRHRNIQTTLRYAHLKPEHLRDTVAALDDAVRGEGPNSVPSHDSAERGHNDRERSQVASVS